MLQSKFRFEVLDFELQIHVLLRQHKLFVLIPGDGSLQLGPVLFLAQSDALKGRDFII